MAKRAWMITVVSAVIALASLAWNVLHTEHSALSVAATSSISLVQMGTSEVSDISVLYRDKPVKNLSKLLITIKNTGNRPLSPEDFTQPLSFHTPSSAGLIAARVEERRPESIYGAILVTADGQTVELQPELLNPGDQLVLALYLTSDLSELPRVTGRVKGVHNIVLADSRTGARDRQVVTPDAQSGGVDSQGNMTVGEILFGLGVLWVLGLGAVATCRGIARAWSLRQSMPALSIAIHSCQNNQQMANVVRRTMLIRLVDAKLEEALLEQTKVDDEASVVAGRMALLFQERVRGALLEQVTLFMIVAGLFGLFSWGFIGNILAQV